MRSCERNIDTQAQWTLYTESNIFPFTGNKGSFVFISVGVPILLLPSSLYPSLPSSGATRKPQCAEMTASNTVFTVFSGIGFTLSVIPLWWHIESWRLHVGTCMYMIWTALACLVHFVDSILWNGNAINWAPVWCDICAFGYSFSNSCHPHEFPSAIRVQIATAVAWPACGFCIIRRLYNITLRTTRARVG